MLPVLLSALSLRDPLLGALLFGALHFGSLHAYERWLAILLAFGPFVVLAVVIAVRRRHDARESDESGPR